MVGKAKVVVAGQVHDFAAVIVAHRGLLIVENAELEIGALGAQFVEGWGQVGELGASSSLGHGYVPQRRSITPQCASKQLHLGRLSIPGGLRQRNAASGAREMPKAKTVAGKWKVAGKIEGWPMAPAHPGRIQ